MSSLSHADILKNPMEVLINYNRFQLINGTVGKMKGSLGSFPRSMKYNGEGIDPARFALL